MNDDDLTPYASWAPTALDCRGLSLPDRQDWLVSDVGTNRDADLLTRSNWEVSTSELDETDPEFNDHEEHDFNHWPCGWFRVVLVRPGSKCHEIALAHRNAISNYPILSEEHHSELEWDELVTLWEGASVADRFHWLKKAGQCVLAARRDEIPSDDNGALRDAMLGH